MLKQDFTQKSSLQNGFQVGLSIAHKCSRTIFSYCFLKSALIDSFETTFSHFWTATGAPLNQLSSFWPTFCLDFGLLSGCRYFTSGWREMILFLKLFCDNQKLFLPHNNYLSKPFYGVTMAWNFQNWYLIRLVSQNFNLSSHLLQR